MNILLHHCYSAPYCAPVCLKSSFCSVLLPWIGWRKKPNSLPQDAISRFNFSNHKTYQNAFVVGALPHTPLGELTALAAGRGSGKKGEGRRRVWKYKGWEKREGKEEGRRKGSWRSATKRGINAPVTHLWPYFVTCTAEQLCRISTTRLKQICNCVHQVSAPIHPSCKALVCIQAFASRPTDQPVVLAEIFPIRGDFQPRLTPRDFRWAAGLDGVVD